MKPRLFITSHARKRYIERVLKSTEAFVPGINVTIINHFKTATENTKWVNNIFAVHYICKRYKTTNIRVFETDDLIFICTLKRNQWQFIYTVLTCYTKESKEMSFGVSITSKLTKEQAAIEIRKMKTEYKSLVKQENSLINILLFI